MVTADRVQLVKAFLVAAAITAGASLVTPEARADLPPPLNTVPVPEPSNLGQFVRDREVAIALGKAFFWDTQVGGDGQTGCATCHSHAGADNRITNTLNPGANGMFDSGSPMSTLTDADFPFHRFADVFDRFSALLFDSDDIVGAQGVVKESFNDIVVGNPEDDCTLMPDPVFNVYGVNVRQVTGRNAPTVIGAIFNHRNFWDGRANFIFNGQSPFGPNDPNAFVLQVLPNGYLAHLTVRIDNASLASQAVGPPNNSVEMSCAGRTFPKLGKKMLSLTPLGLQYVSLDDSRLGGLSAYPSPGLNTSYMSLIQDAFWPRFWDSAKIVDVDGNVIPYPMGTTDEFTLMEFNFSLFWGLAIQLYEATLIPQNTPFDRFVAGDSSALTEQQIRGAGTFFGAGHCAECHTGAEFTSAATSNVLSSGDQLITEMNIAEANAFYDIGFYNIGVRPTAADLGVGGENPPGVPLSFSRLIQMGVDVGSNVQVDPGDRVAVDGAFKVPTLRNVELTGPYSHTGGMLTLSHVAEFYARGGDFHEANIDNLDDRIEEIGRVRNEPTRVLEVAAFLCALTDDDVRWERAPFDHPSICLPNGSELPAIGRYGLAAAGLGPLQPFLAAETCPAEPPIAEAGPDRSCSQGSSVSFDGSGSHDSHGYALTFTWSFGDGSPVASGPIVSHSFSMPGTFSVQLTVSNGSFSATDSARVVVVPLPPSVPDLLLSFGAATTLPGVGPVATSDIVRYNATSSTFSMFFNGADVGLSGRRIGSFCSLPTGELLLSFTARVSIAGLVGGPSGTTVEASDIVRFSPTSLGNFTAGMFTFHLDGSDVGLSGTSEVLDGIALDPSGSLILSITGSGAATGVTSVQDEDLIRFSATSLGSVTSGSFSFYFDGSDVGLSTSSSEDVDAVFVAADGRIFLSTLGSFSVTGATGERRDILRFTPTSIGATTAGTYGVFLRGSVLGIPSSANVTGVSILP